MRPLMTFPMHDTIILTTSCDYEPTFEDGLLLRSIVTRAPERFVLLFRLLTEGLGHAQFHPSMLQLHVKDIHSKCMYRERVYKRVTTLCHAAAA